MEERRDNIKGNILKYIERQNISKMQILKDTGVDLDEKKMLRSEDFLTLCTYLRKDPIEFSDEYFENLSTEQYIRQRATKYNSVFRLLGAKLAFTAEGEIYFFRYNKELEAYDTFTRIYTEDELRLLLFGLMSQDMILRMYDELGAERTEEEMDKIEQSYKMNQRKYEDLSMVKNIEDYKEYVKNLIERLDKVIEMYDNRTSELRDIVSILKED